jgi:hypothetical protein
MGRAYRISIFAVLIIGCGAISGVGLNLIKSQLGGVSRQYSPDNSISPRPSAGNTDQTRKTDRTASRTDAEECPPWREDGTFNAECMGNRDTKLMNDLLVQAKKTGQAVRKADAASTADEPKILPNLRIEQKAWAAYSSVACNYYQGRSELERPQLDHCQTDILQARIKQLQELEEFARAGSM